MSQHEDMQVMNGHCWLQPQHGEVPPDLSAAQIYRDADAHVNRELRGSATTRPGAAADVFRHYAETPAPSRAQEPVINGEGVAIPGTRGRGRFLPIPPFGGVDSPTTFDGRPIAPDSPFGQ